MLFRCKMTSNNISEICPGEFFSVDVEYNGTIADIKSAITLAYTDIEMNSIFLKYNDMKLNNTTLIEAIQYKDGSYIEVHKVSGCCCSIM